MLISGYAICYMLYFQPAVKNFNVITCEVLAELYSYAKHIMAFNQIYDWCFLRSHELKKMF